MRFGRLRPHGEALSTQVVGLLPLVAALALGATGCFGESVVRSKLPVAAVSEDGNGRDIVSEESLFDDALSVEIPDGSQGFSDASVPDGGDAAPTDRGDDAADGDASASDDGAVLECGNASADDASGPTRGAPSCREGLLCGPPGAQRSCCESIVVAGGPFMMGRSARGNDQWPVTNLEELPEHLMTVPGFALDRYEVTVGRYRAYLDAWPNPPVGACAGANAAIAASGWQDAWSDHLPPTREVAMSRLHCDNGNETWTDAPGPNENRPMGCLNWYEAFAFCIWDGGRLATEAEWEYVAAGGEENRIFPWGNIEPDCAHVAPWQECHDAGDLLAPAGTHPLGRGRWGHEDLGGSAEEWMLDYWDYYRAPYPLAQLAPEYHVNSPRTLRGMGFYGGMGDMRAADRGEAMPDARYVRFGVRCARNLAR